MEKKYREPFLDCRHSPLLSPAAGTFPAFLSLCACAVTSLRGFFLSLEVNQEVQTKCLFVERWRNKRKQKVVLRHSRQFGRVKHLVLARLIAVLHMSLCKHTPTSLFHHEILEVCLSVSLLIPTQRD